MGRFASAALQQPGHHCLHYQAACAILRVIRTSVYEITRRTDAHAWVTAMTTAFTRVAVEDSGLASGQINTGHEVGFAPGVSILLSIGGASLAGRQGIAGFQGAFVAGVAIAVLAAGAAVAPLPADRPPLARRVFAH